LLICFAFIAGAAGKLIALVIHYRAFVAIDIVSVAPVIHKVTAEELYVKCNQGRSHGLRCSHGTLLICFAFITGAAGKLIAFVIHNTAFVAIAIVSVAPVIHKVTAVEFDVRCNHGRGHGFGCSHGTFTNAEEASEAYRW